MNDDSGLKDLLSDATNVEQHPYRNYPYNEFEDKAWRWFEEFEKRFPEAVSIQCDFIEVSGRMTSSNARAYYRDCGEYLFIRFSKDYVNNSDDWRLRRTLLHEMVHLYCYSLGYFDIAHSSMFKWLCGAVGAPMNTHVQTDPEWIDLAEPFVQE